MRAAALILIALSACVLNPPGLCSTTADCPQGTECAAGVCAGDGGGVVDTGPGSPPATSYNCTSLPPSINPTSSDVISVAGQAGALGAVSYTIYGPAAYYGTTVARANGFDHFTSGTVAGTSAGTISSTEFWLWNSTALHSRELISGDNSNPATYVPPYIDLRVGAGATASSCPSGAGTATVDLSLFEYPGDGGTQSGVLGTFRFQCPDAGVDLSGCFRYPRY